MNKNSLFYSLILSLSLMSPAIALTPIEAEMRMGMEEIVMPSDGSCLFWSIAAGHNLSQGIQMNHELMKKAGNFRDRVAKALAAGQYEDVWSLFIASDENLKRDKIEYLEELEDGGDAGELEIHILSDLLATNIVIHSEHISALSYPHDQAHAQSIHLWYTGNHYNLLVPKQGGKTDDSSV